MNKNLFMNKYDVDNYLTSCINEQEIKNRCLKVRRSNLMNDTKS